jgi:hypothetical protein
MKAYEDLARLRVDEAIARGLEAQHHRQDAAAAHSPSLAAWTEPPVRAESRAAVVVWGRRDGARRALEAEWARLACLWLTARAWLAEK